MSKSNIHIKKSKVGSLHTHLGIKQGTKIPRSKLTIKKTDSLAIRKKKIFAKNARSWHHHENGGYMDNLPQLGLGDWLQSNVGNIAQAVGGAGLMFVPGGQVAGAGLLASSVGGFAKTAGQEKQLGAQEDAQYQSNQQAMGQNRLAQYNNNNQDPGMIPTFGFGGELDRLGMQHGYGYNLMVNGGDIKSYNPNLAKKDSKFQTWYGKNTLEGQNKIPYSEDLTYDYYSYFKNGNMNGNIEGHFPDTYKRPNHPTFSNESIYSTPEKPGGQWDGENYNPKGKFIMANGGHLPEGNSTLKEAKEFIKLYPVEMKAGEQVEYEHTGNTKLAQRIAADHVKDSIKINQGGEPDYYKKLQVAGISDELNKMPQMAMGGKLSKEKAGLILKEGTIRGKKLTDRQRKYFGFISEGGTPMMATGGQIPSNLFKTDKTAYVDSTLNANKNLDWVKRLYQPNTPDIQIPGVDGRSTHYMGDNGNGYVFPTVVNKDNKLQYLGSEDAGYNYAQQTNTGIQFPQEQGSWFAANGYKKGINVLKGSNKATGGPLDNTHIRGNDPTLLPMKNKQYDDNLSMNNNWIDSLSKGKNINDVNNTVVGTWNQKPLTMDQFNSFPQYVRNGFNSDFTMEQQKLRLGLPNRFQEMNMQPSPGRAGNVQDTYNPKSNYSGDKAYMANGGYFGPAGSISGGIGSVEGFNDQKVMTEYKGGGTHSENPLGGIPIGQKAKVEEGEERYTDSKSGESYIFSARY